MCCPRRNGTEGLAPAVSPKPPFTQPPIRTLLQEPPRGGCDLHPAKVPASESGGRTHPMPRRRLSTGNVEADAQDDFDQARQREVLSRLARWVRRQPTDVNAILPFDEVVAALGRIGERDLGLQPVRLDSIVGTVDRTDGAFDRDFRPTSTKSRDRWVRSAAAMRRGEPLEPITVYPGGGGPLRPRRPPPGLGGQGRGPGGDRRLRHRDPHPGRERRPTSGSPTCPSRPTSGTSWNGCRSPPSNGPASRSPGPRATPAWPRGWRRGASG